MGLDFSRLLSDRSKQLQPSGIRRIFELSATLKDPINLSIGQPDFPVPDAVKRAAIDAIERDHNGYSMTNGVAPLRERCAAHIAQDVGWDTPAVAVTSGTCGALFLMSLALLGEGDEIIVPDPYFVAYPKQATIAGGTAVRCDTYPDFKMTAERVEPLITKRTKAVLLNCPGNPSGAVMTQGECRELLELCRRKGVLLISDEIYDEFTFDDAREDYANGRHCPSPAREPGSQEDVLLIRGFSKTYAVTGWRLGYIAGPAALVSEINKLSQFSFVCAPTPLQYGAMACFDCDMSGTIADYAKRRDMVVERLGQHTKVTKPGGAFYAFVETPDHFANSTQLVEAALKKNVVLIPGEVFSDRDTHFRLSFATDPRKLAQGLDVLEQLLAAAPATR
ncbi:MAG: aminotransferase class I/II-fold pyridoxal phosphate-dependent enzyme [Phycisphaerales bacterium]|nr:aminotransferase class I/II-fold pyridoxal phosphate-dependent enzyme [Phycisphaerales bacterium]